MVNLKYFDPNLIKLSRSETANSVFIYHVGYFKKRPPRLYIKELEGYFTEEKHEGWSSKYLNISLGDNNEGILIDYAKFWKGIGDKISEKCNTIEGEYGSDLMKIKINSDDNLPLGKVIKFSVLVFTIRHVFKKGNKYYPRIFLADCLYDNV